MATTLAVRHTFFELQEADPEQSHGRCRAYSDVCAGPCSTFGALDAELAPRRFPSCASVASTTEGCSDMSVSGESCFSECSSDEGPEPHTSAPPGVWSGPPLSAALPATPVVFVMPVHAMPLLVPVCAEPRKEPVGTRLQGKGRGGRRAGRAAKTSGPVSKAVAPAEWTTVVLQNVTRELTRATLVEALDVAGFARRYDFVYLPKNFQKAVGLGYAVVNFVSHSVALEAMVHFTDVRLVKGAEPCAPGWSTGPQGLQALIDRYRNSPVAREGMPDEYRPVLLAEGVQRPLPPPTRPATAQEQACVDAAAAAVCSAVA